MLFVLLQLLTKNQDVIQKNDDELTYMAPEDGVNQALEHGWCVAQAKGHHTKMIMPVVRLEGCLFFIFFTHAYLVVVGSEIDLGEVGSTSQFIEELVHYG